MGTTYTAIITQKDQNLTESQQIERAYGQLDDTKAVGNQTMTFKNSVIFAQCYRSLKSVGQFAVSNYGNLTGDQITQNEINNVLAVTGVVSSIATGFAVGGIVGGVASVIAEGTKIGLDLYKQNQSAKKQNLATSGYIARIGEVKESGGR